MIRRVALVLASALVALAAACAGANEENAASDVGAGEALSISADVTCTSDDGTTTFVLPATSAGHVNGRLTTSEGISLFSCRNPSPSAATAGAVASCTEREQSLHEGSDKVVVSKHGDALTAVLTLPAPAPDAPAAAPADAGDGDAGAATAPPAAAAPPAPTVSLACTTRDGAAMAAPAPPPPKFADVEAIIQNTCTKCHSNEFSTLTKVRDKRMRMLSKVSSGEMPRGNPTFKDTPAGQTLLTYLTTSPDLP